MPTRMIDELARDLRHSDLQDIARPNLNTPLPPEYDELDPQEQECVRRRVRAVLYSMKAIASRRTSPAARGAIAMVDAVLEEEISAAP